MMLARRAAVTLGASPKPRGFLRSAQSSPGHPIEQGTTDRATEQQDLNPILT